MKCWHNLFDYEQTDGEGNYYNCKLLQPMGGAPEDTTVDHIKLTDETIYLYEFGGKQMAEQQYVVMLEDPVSDRPIRSVYLAGPWFNPEQMERLERVKDLLKFRGFKVFSPKDEILFQPGVTTPEEVLNANTEAILESDLVLVITDGKDVGTMFEAGFTHALCRRILYFWELPVGKFNIMLASTGDVARGWTELGLALDQLWAVGKVSNLAEIAHSEME